MPLPEIESDLEFLLKRSLRWDIVDNLGVTWYENLSYDAAMIVKLRSEKISLLQEKTLELRPTSVNPLKA